MTGPEFEHEVRSVARALWSLSSGEGAAEFIGNDEIDCVCRTEDVVHLIECTTDGRMPKFREQVNKLTAAKRHLEGRGETVKLWAIGRDEPTPQQRSHARDSSVEAQSMQEFKRRLLDSRYYLEARWNYRFGSANDPESGSYQLSDEEWIEQPLVPTGSGDNYTINDICNLLKDGKTVVLVGPFGAGKSLTVREIFKHLRRDYYRNRSGRTPIAINLRDHWGQSEIEEILRRHANRVGFEKPTQLVRAWNAGELLPLLDGIDELASPVMAIGDDAIRRSREEALRVIQAFMRDVRGRTGVLLTGRDHYFDSTDEARRLMRLPTDAIFVDVGEFSEDQSTEYLRKKGIRSELPTWLPRKPLLLGYLASRGLLEEVTLLSGDSGSALAWDRFLDRICEREADLSADIDSSGVRQLLEALATRVRSLARGSGPLYDADLANSYKSITGFDPSPAARTLLQRLPGLTARDQEVGARSFVDDEMMEALQAGSVARFIVHPYANPGVADSLKYPLNAFGCSVVGHLAGNQGASPADYAVAATAAMQRWGEPTLALDAVLAGSYASDVEHINADGLTITNGLADVIDMSEHPIANLRLADCVVNTVIFDSNDSTIRFNRCSIIKLQGIANSHALPEAFVACDVGEYDNRHTNSAIVGSELPNSIKVMLVIIRKLFLQRGSGRADSALYRGIGDPLRQYVTPVIDLLVSEGIVYTHSTGQRTIWHGNRVQRPRMLKLLEGPMNSGDALVSAAAKLSGT